jgi:hypothetical protein
MISVAYKLAVVFAGFADITFVLTPKNEWDVVACAPPGAERKWFLSALPTTQLSPPTIGILCSPASWLADLI